MKALTVNTCLVAAVAVRRPELVLIYPLRFSSSTVTETPHAPDLSQGQTSSGKTHTMRGSAQEAGLIPLAAHDIFRLIGASQDREYIVRISYTEVRVAARITAGRCAAAPGRPTI